MASAIGYGDSEQMMGDRGVNVDHYTIYCWVQRYAPEIENRLRGQRRRPQSTSWRVYETYVKVRGKWTNLYRALDKLRSTIDFYLSPTWDAKAAKRFLGKALNGLKDWEKQTVINTDKAPTYGIAISELKAEGKCPDVGPKSAYLVVTSSPHTSGSLRSCSGSTLDRAPNDQPRSAIQLVSAAAGLFLGWHMASLAALPSRNFTVVLAAILIDSPVAGLRPMRAAR